MRKNTKVTTPDGEGIIVDIEHYSRLEGGINRYGVKLAKSPYFYEVAYYWPKEIKRA